MTLAKKAFKAFLFNTAARLAEFGLTLAITVVLTRGLGPERFGKYAVVMTFCGLFGLIANFGLEETLNAQIPKHERDKSRQTSIFSSLLGVRILLLTFVAGLALILAEPISSAMASPGLADLIRLSVPFIFIANVNALFMFLLTGLFRFGTLGFTKVLSLSIQLFGVAAVMSLGGGITEVIIVLFASNFILLGVYLLINRRYVKFRIGTVGLLPLISFGTIVWLANLVNFGLGKQSDIILMGLFRVPEADIGYYQTAYGAVNTFNMLLISGFIGVTLASFAEASTRDEGLLGSAWQLTIKAYAVIALPALAFSVVHANAIIVGVFSEKYAAAVLLFQIYGSFMFFTKLLGGGNHITLLYATGRQNTAFFIRLVAGLGNVILNLFFIPWLGALGALTATGLSQLSVIIAELVVVKRFVKARFPVAFNAKLAAACVIGLIPGILLVPGHLWTVAIFGTLFYITILALLYLLKPLAPGDVSTLSGVNPLLGRIARGFARGAGRSNTVHIA